MSLCKFPIYREVAGGIVGCGRCLPCRINKRLKKSTRFTLEGLCHEHAVFVGLSYMDEYLPTTLYNPRTGEISYSHETGCVDKFAIQKFIKRLKSNVRRTCGRDAAQRIRFFAAGEYGEKKERPHYHLVIWGIPPKYWYFIPMSWRDPRTKALMCNPDRITMEEPRSIWDVGSYCCAYIMKNNFDKKALIASGRPPEFTTSSQGFGAMSVPALVSVFKKYSGQVYIEMNKDIPRSITLNGKKCPIDRYLREKILNALQKAPEIKEFALQRYKSEMQALQIRAQKNSEISTLAKTCASYGYLLEKQYALENAQAIANVESRHSMFKK